MSTIPDDALTPTKDSSVRLAGWLLARCFERPVRLLERMADRWVMPLGVTRVSWIGSVTGVAGALALAVNLRWSGIGWLLFLASNFCWMGYALQQRTRSMLLMQSVFTITSLIGVYRWLV